MEELNPSEISQVIKEKIDALDTSATPSNEGTIVYLADGIARIHGLAEVMNGELVEFDGTNQIFTNPSKKETEDYITGKFG